MVLSYSHEVAQLTPCCYSLNGWGLTIVDSLDTMLLMDLRSQFMHAVHEHVVALNFTDPLQRSVRRSSFFYPYVCTFNHLLTIPSIIQNTYVPFFETQIRYFGGLLSSYHLASISPGEEVREAASILRTKAEDLGEAMLSAFNTTSGLPAGSVDTSRYARCKPHYPSALLSSTCVDAHFSVGKQNLKQDRKLTSPKSRRIR